MKCSEEGGEGFVGVVMMMARRRRRKKKRKGAQQAVGKGGSPPHALSLSRSLWKTHTQNHHFFVQLQLHTLTTRASPTYTHHHRHHHHRLFALFAHSLHFLLCVCTHARTQKATLCFGALAQLAPACYRRRRFVPLVLPSMALSSLNLPSLNPSSFSPKLGCVRACGARLAAGKKTPMLPEAPPTPPTEKRRATLFCPQDQPLDSRISTYAPARTLPPRRKRLLGLCVARRARSLFSPAPNRLGRVCFHLCARRRRRRRLGGGAWCVLRRRSRAFVVARDHDGRQTLGLSLQNQTNTISRRALGLRPCLPRPSLSLAVLVSN